MDCFLRMCFLHISVLGGDIWRARYRPDRHLPWWLGPTARANQCLLQWGYRWDLVYATLDISGSPIVNSHVCVWHGKWLWPFSFVFCVATYRDMFIDWLRSQCGHEHYDDVIMTILASQITSLTVVYSIVYSGVNQRNIKAPRHWPLCGKFTGDRWISRTNGQLRGKYFHLMTSSWRCHCDKLG